MSAEKKFGLVQVFWGDGKGKSTAAIGQGFRAAGRGFKVHLIQFLKGGIKNVEDFEEYGELSAIKKFPNFTVERFGLKEWYVKGFSKAEEHRKILDQALKAAEKSLTADKYDLVILDECLYCVQMGLIDEKEIVELIKKKNKNTELILTGSHKSLPTIEAAADLVTNVKKIKHPFDKGVPARIGTEF